MKDEHVFFKDGQKWNRRYYANQMSIDTQLDPQNKQQFVRRTEKYKTLGETMDASKELSLKREQQCGRDEVKQTHFDEYSKARNGAKHPASMPKKFENDRISIDLS